MERSQQQRPLPIALNETYEIRPTGATVVQTPGLQSPAEPNALEDPNNAAEAPPDDQGQVSPLKIIMSSISAFFRLIYDFFFFISSGLGIFTFSF